MKAKSFFVMSVASLIMLACQERGTEKAVLQSKIDSLVTVAESNQFLAETMNEADALLDSIDESRNILRTKLWEGTSYDDFTSRIKELNSYVKRSESKINELESALRASKQSGSSYSARIKSLKEAVDNSAKELAMLQEQVTKYKDENDNLVKTVNLQQAEIEDKLNQIASKQGEVEQLEGRITEILSQARQDEADAYFAQGVAYELAADRTGFLAVKKKKAARQQALDMYQMAVLYGKHEAQEKVDELQKKLGKSGSDT
jgi:chromosome segregation ATPase